MPNRKPIAIGTRFTRLVVIGHAPPQYYGTAKIRMYAVRCRCDCGKEFEVVERSLIHKWTKSCGCLNKELSDARRFKHGHAYNRNTYGTWDAMIQRCTNPNNHAYKHYGGRGITVCVEWMDFRNFLADMGERPPSLTLERINNSLGYFRENCRWATRSEQQANRRGNRIIEWQGIRGCLNQVCRHFGISGKLVSYRLDKGWSIEDAMLLPKHSRKPNCHQKSN